MKKRIFILLCLLYLLSMTSVNSKFAHWVVNIPCSKIKVRVDSCKAKSYSNEKGTITLYGTLLSGEITSQEMIQCFPTQEIDKKHFKKVPTESKKFFVINQECKKTPFSSEFTIKNYFCDTPGAMGIRDCYLNALKSREGVLVGE